MSYHIRTSCRLCSSEKLNRVLELESTPLANEFVNPNSIRPQDELFPLYLAMCEDCMHVQLPVIVDPRRLFSDYVYVSGTSPSFVNHFKIYAEQLREKHSLIPGDLIVEIGSNDGTMLKFFKEMGCRVVGVDPALNLARTASEQGIPTLPTFFDQNVAEKILSTYGKAKLVIANNVFAHADDLIGITTAIATLLQYNDGKFVFEVQYLPALLKHNLFDMIYHEHLSYHSVAPLIPFFNKQGLEIERVENIDTHGGSIRVQVGTLSNDKKNNKESFAPLLLEESRLIKLETFNVLKEKINQARSELLQMLKMHNGRVLGFGAPAKLTTLLYQLGIKQDEIEFVVDDNPLKQGLLTPGLRIPIIGPEQFRSEVRKTDKIIIFAWNFASQITQKYPELKGQFIIPLPLPRLV